MAPEADKELLSLKEAAELLNVSERTIHRRIASGELTGFTRLANGRGVYMFSRSALLAEINGRIYGQMTNGE